MLGTLSEKYESNGDPGCVSTGYGDAGGVSYGCYQLATNTDSVHSFVRWLINNDKQYADVLCVNSPGTYAFSETWKNIAENDSDAFFELQNEYIKYAYYEPSVRELSENYFNIENHSEVMKDVVWSRAVQYGTGNIVEMFDTAAKSLGYDNLSYVDAKEFDEEMIKAIYLNVCSTPEWTNGSPSLREGLYNRFQNECNDALERLSNEA